jgi:hypothetical protein
MRNLEIKCGAKLSHLQYYAHWRQLFRLRLRQDLCSLLWFSCQKMYNSLHCLTPDLKDLFLTLLQDKRYPPCSGSHLVTESVSRVFQFDCQSVVTFWVQKTWCVFVQEGPVLESTGHPGLLICMSVLTWRSCVSMGREFGYYWLRLLLSAVLSLCIGTMYFNLGHSVDSVRVRLNNIHHTNLDSACECTCIPFSVPFQW